MQYWGHMYVSVGYLSEIYLGILNFCSIRHPTPNRHLLLPHTPPHCRSPNGCVYPVPSYLVLLSVPSLAPAPLPLSHYFCWMRCISQPISMPGSHTSTLTPPSRFHTTLGLLHPLLPTGGPGYCRHCGQRELRGQDRCHAAWVRNLGTLGTCGRQAPTPKDSSGSEAEAPESTPPLSARELLLSTSIHPIWTSMVAQPVKNPLWRRSPPFHAYEADPVEKEMETCPSVLAWRIPWTEEPGGLQPTGSQRVTRAWLSETTTFYPNFAQLMPVKY